MAIKVAPGPHRGASAKQSSGLSVAALRGALAIADTVGWSVHERRTARQRVPKQPCSSASPLCLQLGAPNKSVIQGVKSQTEVALVDVNEELG